MATIGSPPAREGTKIKPPPMRTCIACREVLPKYVLIRVTVRDQRLRADPIGRAPGRGAYICMRKECLDAAKRKKGAFSRALRYASPLHEVEALLGELDKIISGRHGGGLSRDNKRPN